MTLPSRSTQSENNQLEHAAHTTDMPFIQSLSMYEHKDCEIGIYLSFQLIFRKVLYITFSNFIILERLKNKLA